MAQAQHGRKCSCHECVELYQFARIGREPARPPWQETTTVEQLRDAYEEALDELQALTGAHRMFVGDTGICGPEPLARAEAFLRDRGRTVVR